MAKYQQYEEYKDSGVEWLDVIPNHWNTVSLKMLIDVRDGTHETPSYVEKSDNSYPLVTSKDVTSGQIDLTDCKYISQQDYESIIKRSAVSKGDILMPMIGTVGSPVLVEERLEIAIKNLALFRTSESNEKITVKFLYYFLNSKECSMQFSLEGRGGVQNFVSLGTLRSLGLPLITLNEQIQIANFLDHETAQIDTLIEKQQTLIKLLKEKRQAVISHAVTKGLNPDAPMKDSGVEWLGEVPEHWDVTKFSHCAQIRNGLVDPKAPDFKNLVLYAPNHIEKDTGKIVYKETAEEQGADSSKYLCYKDEVIYSKIRPALAKVAICEEETALCSADMYPINAVNGLDNQFLYFFMLSDNFTKAAILDSDRVAMPKINRESLSDYRLPVPPTIEQIEICRFIADQNTKLEELESKATKAIQLMQERRTALISAAVTGKIDVRGWVAPN